MTRTWTRLLAACGMVLAAGSAAAFDPSKTDILRLRLGMNEAEVIAILAAQGLSGPGLHRAVRTCGGDPAAVCVALLQARTGDGTLTISFGAAQPDAGRPTVNAIQYWLDGRQPGEPAMIQTAVLDRFGHPSSKAPLAWCGQVDPGGFCPMDRPRLAFLPGPGFSSVLLLSDGTPIAKLER